ncbi:MAG: alkaline phosphatase family protein [Crocinitomicaceae bacterium]|nr:alkaline phosphatase family protein [Crocinitomicaceae bacterium]MBP6033314.1 alkaline phosphatase family protein [Crocinitomicaceae bacterium]
MSSKKKVLVIGWDAAEWKVIMPLIQQGKMPALSRLMSRGVHGKLQTLDPPLSPMLWTSIATGFRADTHGIGGFIEPTPDGENLRPVTSTSRKVKAIWNILNQEGYKSNVVAWWPSNPAEPINGVMVSNLYQIATKPLSEEWEMPKGTVHPEELSEKMKEFRIHPHQINLEQAQAFLPNIKTDEALRSDPRTASVLRTMANAGTIHSATCHLLEHTEWDFTAVYHDAIDHFSHIAMRYFPPRRPEIPEKDFNDFKDVVEAAYLFHDRMLARMMSLIDEENTTVLLISDHGFHCDHQRPLYIPKEPSGPAVEHSPFGVFVMAGPGIKNDGRQISGLSVLDITPTLLHHMELPVGKDMEGKVLHACFEKAREVNLIESWEQVPGDAGMHDEILREDPWAAQEALQQLVDLGYIDALDDDKIQQVEKSKRENEYYIARNLLNAGKFAPAIEILDRIYSESKIQRYGQRLAFAYLTKRQYRKSMMILEELSEQNKQSQRAEDAYDKLGMEQPMYLDYLEGLILLAMNKPHLSLPKLLKIQEKNPYNYQLALNIAQIFLQRKKYILAENQFIRALNIDDSHARAHHGLGLTFLRRGNMNAAIEEFLIAIDYDFFFHRAHYHLGEALVRQGLYEDAIQAFEVNLRIAPKNVKSHKWLYEIYRDHLKDTSKAEYHEQQLEKSIKGERIICTEAVAQDQEKVLDFIESFGYSISQDKSVMEKAANLFQDASWLEDIGDQIIFIPSHSLSFLPDHFNYKLLYVQSQVDLSPKNKDGESLSTILSTKKLAHFEQEQAKIEAWMESQANLSVLYLTYSELKENKEEQGFILDNFLKK